MDKRSLRAKKKARKLRVYGLCSGRGEAPQELSAKPDETGLVLDTYPVPITQEPLCYVSEDLIIIVSIVGKHWLRDSKK